MVEVFRMLADATRVQVLWALVDREMSVNELAERVQRVGQSLNLKVDIQHLDNPRKEMEEHYYNPAHHGLAELGLKPHLMTDDVVAGMLEQVIEYRDHIVPDRILPRVRWR